MHSVITSEVAYLRDYNLGFTKDADVVVAVRATLNQAMHCYTSSGIGHAMHLLRHLAGHVQFYFDENHFTQITRPHPEQDCFGSWLIILDKIVRNCEESVYRGAIGDVRSHFMTILSIVLGAMEQHGGEKRQGYEDGIAKGVTR